MTTVYSKNGICFLIPPASNYRCNGEVWCYCNNSEYNLTENESRTNPVGNENNKRTSCFYFNE